MIRPLILNPIAHGEIGDRVAPLVAHVSVQRKLSKMDIPELRKLLREFDDEQH